MPNGPHLPGLVKFLKSSLDPTQLEAVIHMLQDDGRPPVLDPEAAGPRPGPAKTTAPPREEQRDLRQNINALLEEMEAAYSVEKFSPLTADESRRVRDAYPGFIDRCGANQGRHLCRMLREKLGQANV
jgi:hypothetical protein